MTRSPPPIRPYSMLALLCLAVVLVFPACSDGAAPTTAPTSTTTLPSTTTTTTTTTTPPPTSTVPPTTTTVPPTTTTPDASDGVGDLAIDRDSVWQDVFDALTFTEQSSVREAVGAELDWVLEQAIHKYELSDQEMVFFRNLPARLVRAVFLAGMTLGLEDEGLEVSEEQEACLREVVAQMDVVTLLSVMDTEAEASDDAAQLEAAAQLLEMAAGVVRCLPGLLDDDLADWDDVDEDDFADGFLDPTREEAVASVVLGEAVRGVVDHEGDMDFFLFEAVEDELYEIDVALGTLYDSAVAVYAVDGTELAYNDDRVDSETSLASRLVWRAPASGEFVVGVSSFDRFGLGSYILMVSVSDIVDDFASAAEVVLGESVEGVLDYEGDVDVFVFEATEGEVYEAEVGLGSLSDSMVKVYDEYWTPYAFNDDGWDDSPASRAVWTAAESGDFYVEVSGYPEGSYMLTVGISDVVDDFSNRLEGAASVVLGESVEGVLDYRGDLDYFVFEAVEGELYEVEMAAGTLSAPFLTIFDEDGFYSAANDERLVWRATATGKFYLEAASNGEDEGSYTLKVAVSE